MVQIEFEIVEETSAHEHKTMTFKVPEENVKEWMDDLRAGVDPMDLDDLDPDSLFEVCEGYADPVKESIILSDKHREIESFKNIKLVEG